MMLGDHEQQAIRDIEAATKHQVPVVVVQGSQLSKELIDFKTRFEASSVPSTLNRKTERQQIFYQLCSDGTLMKCRDNAEVIASFLHLILMLEQKSVLTSPPMSPRSPRQDEQLKQHKSKNNRKEETKETMDEAGEQSIRLTSNIEDNYDDLHDGKVSLRDQKSSTRAQGDKSKPNETQKLNDNP